MELGKYLTRLSEEQFQQRCSTKRRGYEMGLLPNAMARSTSTATLLERVCGWSDCKRRRRQANSKPIFVENPCDPFNLSLHLFFGKISIVNFDLVRMSAPARPTNPALDDDEDLDLWNCKPFSAFITDIFVIIHFCKFIYNSYSFLLPQLDLPAELHNHRHLQLVTPRIQATKRGTVAKHILLYPINSHVSFSKIKLYALSYSGQLFCNCSEDTAARQTRLAKARLRDHEEISTQPTNAQTNLSPAAAPISLPSAADIFTAVAGPPAFLNPEATRQIVTLSNQGTGGQGQRADAGTLPGGDTREGAWDISRMAPKLAGEEELQPGVISARAKKYKGADGAAVEASAAQVAMLGGNPAERRDRGKGTKAMGVDEFLEKGVGGAQLPRKQQDRKDKEKSKRERGQSTHSHWKSEAEMALRQQYD